MSKLAPQRKRPKRVAKKIERRFGLAHYDKKAILALAGEDTEGAEMYIKQR